METHLNVCVRATPRTTFVMLLLLLPSWSCHERKIPSALGARGSELVSVSRGEVRVYMRDGGKDRTCMSQLIIAETPPTPRLVSALLFCKAETDAQAVIINFYSNKQSLLIPSAPPPLHPSTAARSEGLSAMSRM